MTFVRSTYRLVALIMAFLMFFSSAGFAMDMHFCQGKLKSISFFGKARTCHDMAEGTMKNCPRHKKMMAEKKSCSEDNNCCSNKTIHFQSDQDQQYQVGNGVVISPQLQYFVIAFVEAFINSSIVETDKPSFAHYKPPLKPRDIYVLLETYLL